MFVGHLALALAARGERPAASLAWYVGAVSTADLLWPLFLFFGMEHARIEPGATAFTPIRFEAYPWSHSLVMMVAWGAALAVLARWRGVDARAATLVGALVVSHWVLDAITHAQDMPLWPGRSPHYGLALWNSIPATLVVEGALWAAAIAWFLRRLRPRGAHGAIAFWSFVLVPTFLWAGSPFGPPPPDERALAFAALAGWTSIPWAMWVERHIAPRT